MKKRLENIAKTAINFIEEHERSIKRTTNVELEMRFSKILYDLKEEALESCTSLKERALTEEYCRDVGIYVDCYYRRFRINKDRAIYLIKDKLEYL